MIRSEWDLAQECLAGFTIDEKTHDLIARRIEFVLKMERNREIVYPSNADVLRELEPFKTYERSKIIDEVMAWFIQRTTRLNAMHRLIK